MLSILCVGRVIFIHYFYCFLLLLLAQRREPDVIDFNVFSCSPEKGSRVIDFVCIIFIHYFYCFLLLLLAQRREPNVIDFVCRSCNIHPLFLLFFITFVSPEKGARCY